MPRAGYATEIIKNLVEIKQILKEVTVEETEFDPRSYEPIRVKGISWPEGHNCKQLANLVRSTIRLVNAAVDQLSSSDFSFLSRYLEQLDSELAPAVHYYKVEPIDEANYLQQDSRESFRSMKRLASTWTDTLVWMLRGGEENAAFKALYFSFPTGIFESDVTDSLNLTYSEVIEDYQNGCYISAIVLCGRVVETILGALYRKVCGGDADRERLGIDAICNRLQQQGYDFKKDAIRSKMDLIAAQRNKAVHGAIVIPTKEEAMGIPSLTKDVMQKAARRA
jgi:hypothetical protein